LRVRANGPSRPCDGVRRRRTSQSGATGGPPAAWIACASIAAWLYCRANSRVQCSGTGTRRSAPSSTSPPVRCIQRPSAFARWVRSPCFSKDIVLNTIGLTIFVNGLRDKAETSVPEVSRPASGGLDHRLAPVPTKSAARRTGQYHRGLILDAAMRSRLPHCILRALADRAGAWHRSVPALLGVLTDGIACDQQSPEGRAGAHRAGLAVLYAGPDSRSLRFRLYFAAMQPNL
jgi:hypothetical protein